MSEKERAKEKRDIILAKINDLSDEEILKGGEFTIELRGKPLTVTFGNGLPPGPPPPPPPPPGEE